MSGNKPSYKSLNAELEVIIEDLQSNNLDIDRVLTQYERGVNIIDELEKYLNQAENRLTKVKPKKPINTK